RARGTRRITDAGVEVLQDVLRALFRPDVVDRDAEVRAQLPLVADAVLPRVRKAAIRVVEADRADVALERPGRELRVDRGMVHERPRGQHRVGGEVAGARSGVGV